MKLTAIGVKAQHASVKSREHMRSLKGLMNELGQTPFHCIPHLSKCQAPVDAVSPESTHVQRALST